jgi:hypothetical protein
MPVWDDHQVPVVVREGIQDDKAPLKPSDNQVLSVSLFFRLLAKNAPFLLVCLRHISQPPRCPENFEGHQPSPSLLKARLFNRF